MTTKMTHKDYFNRLSAIVALSAENGLVSATESANLTAFINGRIEAIVKKNGAERKPTKTQQANIVLAETILDVMEENTLYTVSQILKMLDDDTLNQSKVSAVIRGMLVVTANGVVNPDGKIERIVEKGTAYFKKVAVAEESEEIED